MAHDSSLSVRPFDHGGMIEVSHFTGDLLLSAFEANHLRTLLTKELGDTPEMPLDEAERVVAEREALLAPYR